MNIAVTGAGDLEAAELVSIQKDVGQLILQSHFQKFVARTGDRPTVFVMVIHEQTVICGGVPEFAVVVTIPKAGYEAKLMAGLLSRRI